MYITSRTCKVYLSNICSTKNIIYYFVSSKKVSIVPDWCSVKTADLANLTWMKLAFPLSLGHCYYSRTVVSIMRPLRVALFVTTIRSFNAQRCNMALSTQNTPLDAWIRTALIVWTSRLIVGRGKKLLHRPCSFLATRLWIAQDGYRHGPFCFAQCQPVALTCHQCEQQPVGSTGRKKYENIQRC